MSYRFLKGHGTENDFVLLPDHDASVHGDLPAERVRALCDRRAGLGADGVLRVVRSAALALDGPEWFMDYRNADGSVSEMCGNGVRVFAQHLVDEGLASAPLEVGTRDGAKAVRLVDGEWEVDLGRPRSLAASTVSVESRSWPAVGVDMGNPHAVVFVDSLAEAGSLLEQPAYDAEVYPEGVNVEFVHRVGPQHVAMRVHERGSGETRSCGTGAGAVCVASAMAEGAGPGSSYRVDVPGGRLTVTWTEEDHVLLRGPAVVVAEGHTDL